MPPAPFQVVSTATALRSAPAGVTVQVVTMLEFVSRSTIWSALGALTSTSWSRARFLVACSIQCTRLPAPRAARLHAVVAVLLGEDRGPHLS